MPRLVALKMLRQQRVVCSHGIIADKIITILYAVASSDSEEETVKREADGDSSEGDDLNEEGQGEIDEEDGEGLQLFAGHTPLGWKKGGVLGDKRTERRRKKKRKSLDKETKETLRRQEVSEMSGTWLYLEI